MKFILLITSTLTFILTFSCKSTDESTADTEVNRNTRIGTKQFIWEDNNREDNYYGGPRTINAQLWYPSDQIDSNQTSTPYLLFFRQLYNKLDNWSAADYQLARNANTTSVLNAPISKKLASAPLLIFSPSLGGNLSYYTYYAEHFAKKGYIVMGINHLHESEAIIDKDSSVFVANLSFHDSLKVLNIPQEITAEEYRAVKGIRQKVLGEDLIFGLNQIFADSVIGSLIDHSKIGVFGHSIGGSAAVYASILDSRIKTVINLDGTPPSIALNDGIDVPFLFIEDLTDYRNHQGYAKMHKRRSDFCELNRADAWRIMISGFNHNNFLDINYYFADHSTSAQKEKENLDSILSYMDVFLNYHLLGKGELDLEPHVSDKVELHRFRND